MTRFVSTRMFTAAALAIGLAAAPALAQTPSAHIDFHGGSVAFIAGVHWGDGTLRFHHKTYALKVGGLGVGEIGASSFTATGEVYHLRKFSDIEGTYGAVEASATAGAGAGEIDMKNDKGVEIRAHASSAGLKLALAPSGMVINLK